MKESKVDEMFEMKDNLCVVSTVWVQCVKKNRSDSLLKEIVYSLIKKQINPQWNGREHKHKTRQLELFDRVKIKKCIELKY